MPHYGILRKHKLSDVDDLRGAEIYGVNDERLGKIDDVIFNHSTGEIRYVVLKTGGLLSSKRLMVPAGRVQPYGNHEDKFYAELDEERLQMLPEFHDEMLNSEAMWTSFEKDNEQRWNDGSVLYDNETGIVTPSPQEVMQPPGGQPLSQKAKESLDGLGPIGSKAEFESAPPGSIPESMREPRVYKLDTTQQDAESHSERQEMLPANYGRRWNDFQKKLREHKDQVIGGCALCGSQDKAA